MCIGKCGNGKWKMAKVSMACVDWPLAFNHDTTRPTDPLDPPTHFAQKFLHQPVVC